MPRGEYVWYNGSAMNNLIRYGALCACAVGMTTLAAETESTEPVQKTVRVSVSSNDGQQYTKAQQFDLVKKALVYVREMIGALQGVKDTATADAAAEKIHALAVKVKETDMMTPAPADQVKEPSEEEAKGYLMQIMMLSMQLNTIQEKIESNDYYKSEKLKAAINELNEAGATAMPGQKSEGDSKE